jgi:uncharacterized membrane protein YkgB
MNQLTDKTVSFTGASSTDGRGADRDLMNFFVRALIKLGIRNEDLGYHLIRASMVIIFFFFGYQKWFEYEVERLIPYISNGPLIFWLYPALGMRGATWFLGVSEWTFGTLLFLGFWNRKLGILGALGSSATFIATVTIIPFMPDGWDAAAGGFPAMTGNVPFLMKDVVLLATSLYLLTQDLRRELLSTGTGEFVARSEAPATVPVWGYANDHQSAMRGVATQPLVFPSVNRSGRQPGDENGLVLAAEAKNAGQPVVVCSGSIECWHPWDALTIQLQVAGDRV